MIDRREAVQGQTTDEAPTEQFHQTAHADERMSGRCLFGRAVRAGAGESDLGVSHRGARRH